MALVLTEGRFDSSDLGSTISFFTGYYTEVHPRLRKGRQNCMEADSTITTLTGNLKTFILNIVQKRRFILTKTIIATIPKPQNLNST